MPAHPARAAHHREPPNAAGAGPEQQSRPVRCAPWSRCERQAQCGLNQSAAGGESGGPTKPTVAVLPRGFAWPYHTGDATLVPSYRCSFKACIHAELGCSVRWPPQPALSPLVTGEDRQVPRRVTPLAPSQPQKSLAESIFSALVASHSLARFSLLFDRHDTGKPGFL